MKMTILNQKEIIRGIKPIKIKPTFNSGRFDKSLPIGEHNYPLSNYTHWEIFGYKKDVAGIRKPFWLNKVLPTGVSLTPQKVGLDGFYTVKPTYQKM